MYTIKVIKFDVNNFGQWALVDLCNECIKFTGIVSFDKSYDLVVDQIYTVKTIDIRRNKSNGKYSIKIGL